LNVLYVPQVFPTIDNLYVLDIVRGDKIYYGSLLSFCEGTDLSSHEDYSIDLARDIGIKGASLNIALQNFRMSSPISDNIWIIDNALQARDLIQKVELNGAPQYFKSELLHPILEEFERLLPTFSSLPKSIIHGDLNPGNIIVNGNEVSSLIDFGDSCYTITISEVAIAIAYILMKKEWKVERTKAIIEGYNSIRKIDKEEFLILPILVKTRLVCSVAMSGYNKVLFPENKYITIHEKMAWELLENLSSKTNEQFFLDIFD